MILFTSAAMLLASCGKSKDTTLIVPLLLSAGTQNGASPADAGTDQTPATLGTVDALTSPAVEPASEDLEDTDSAEDAEQEPNAPNDTAETADISCDRTVAIDTSAGNWFETPRSTRDERSVSGIHTYWQDQALMVHVRGNCKAGWFRIRVTAKNTAGPLPSWYSHFLVGVKDSDRSHDYESIAIKASDDHYSAGSRLVFLSEGDSHFKLTWSNDAYRQGAYDANIQIKSIQIVPAKKKTAKEHKN